MSSGAGHDIGREQVHDSGVRAASPICASCGSPSAQPLDTSDGRVLLCRPCAVMHDLGCP